MIYLDANASEPLRPEARDATIAALSLPGNPASIHAAGRASRQILEDARKLVGTAWGVAPSRIVFCSGATATDALAIAGLGAGRRVLIGATEHDAVAEAAPDAEILPVNADGTLNLDALRGALAGRPALVCVMQANNETGVLHPLAEIAALCREAGALLHVDAAQAAGRVPLGPAIAIAASVAISGHKFGGPKGAGALILASDVSIAPLIRGGGQERGARGGTPAVPAIAGLAAAARAATPVQAERLAALREAMEAQAVAAGAVVCGTGPRLPNTSCLALPGVAAQTQIMALDLAGFAVSSGAACSSGKVAPSRVLRAMGLGPLADCAIRVSLPWNARDDGVEAFAAAYRTMADRLRKPAPRAISAA